jgi:hypothetical protein
VKITYKRKESEYTTSVILKKSPGNYDEVVKANVAEFLGADLETLDSKKADQYDIAGGVVVKKIKEGGALGRTRMQNGFIITSVNGREVKTVEELGRALSVATGTIRFEGMYPGSDMYTYPLSLDGDDN